MPKFSALALFDFDGTITRKDSLIDFIQFAVGARTYYFGLIKLSPMLMCYMLRMIPNHIAKEKFIANYFKNWHVDRFQKIANVYSLEKVNKITRLKAIKKIEWHKSQGHKVVIVTASIECWLKSWCDIRGLDIISTRLEVINDKLTGKFATKNCYGIEKVNRIKEVYNLSDYNQIYAYGDSNGDKELLAIATKKHYKYFN